MSKERSRNDQGLFRFYYVAVTSPFFVTRMIFTEKYMMKHPEKYDSVKKFKFAKTVMNHMKRRGRVNTDYYGRENLPKEGGYIMYSNHQGKYDAIGIMVGQKEPCAILMEKKQSERIVARQVINLTDGYRLDLDNPKAQLKTLSEMAKDIENGKRCLVFPEGKWGDNKNTLQKFNAGCFRASYDSKTPVVPVTIIDSYKGLNGNSLKRVTTQVHFLEPIPYEEYKDMKRNELCDLVKERIQAKLDEVLNARKEG